MSTTVREHIPEFGKRLVKYSAGEMLARVGQDAVRDVVASILCGGNVRSLTEGLTRRRIALSNAAVLVTYMESLRKVPGFVESPFDVVAKELLGAGRLKPEEKAVLEYLMGLTGKGIQNILRGDTGNMQEYLDTLNETLDEVSERARAEIGELTMSLDIGSDNVLLGWRNILVLLTAVGAQAIAIRGSEKSMYGKLFEKLVLGSCLSVLGFRAVKEDDVGSSEGVFWLSSRGKKRESDATLLLRPGVGVRFDIGFIGPGNTEISLDKVSRFERKYELKTETFYMSTIVIVDRIGKGSRIQEMAKAIDGRIIQMSMSLWVKELARALNVLAGFEHELLELGDVEVLRFVEEGLDKVDLASFV